MVDPVDTFPSDWITRLWERRLLDMVGVKEWKPNEIVRPVTATESLLTLNSDCRDGAVRYVAEPESVEGRDCVMYKGPDIKGELGRMEGPKIIGSNPGIFYGSSVVAMLSGLQRKRADVRFNQTSGTNAEAKIRMGGEDMKGKTRKAKKVKKLSYKSLRAYQQALYADNNRLNDENAELRNAKHGVRKELDAAEYTIKDLNGMLEGERMHNAALRGKIEGMERILSMDLFGAKKGV